MKNITKIPAMILALAFIAVLANGCGGACSDLEKKKAECTGDGKDVCEKIIDEAVKAGNNDACKAALDNMNKKK